jgi:tRNA (adenine57-N1/adenine58-N1)-methyltransferase catalytic subunit
VQPETASGRSEIAAGPERGRVREGDIVLLCGQDRKEFLVRMVAGQEHQTHRGVLPHDEVIGQPWGITVHTHLGYAYQVLPPSLDQLVRKIKRATQIIYPKEIGYIVMKMNIGPGTHVIEAGTGSGGLTLAMARLVRPGGHIYSYDVRPDLQGVARENLAEVGLSDQVTFKERDIVEGFDERDVDALFLDVRRPWLYLTQAHAALKGGGFFGCILPTTNQIAKLLSYFEAHPFDFVEVEELMLRPYKPVADRLRPFDRIVGHTGYLIFARAILPTPDREGQAT